MRVENPSIVVWRAEQPVLWRAGAIAAEVVTSETVLPETVVVGLPSDDVRKTLLAGIEDVQAWAGFFQASIHWARIG